MDFSTINTTDLEQSQFSGDDPMSLTVSIINAAEAALREMNSSKSKSDEPESQLPQQLLQGPIYYLQPSGILSEIIVPPQPIFVTINASQGQEQQVEQTSQQGQELITAVVVDYNNGGNAGTGGVPMVPQEELPALPPPPPASTQEVEVEPLTTEVGSSNSNSSDESAEVLVYAKKTDPTSSSTSKIIKKKPNEEKNQFIGKSSHHEKEHKCRFCDAIFSTLKYVESHMNMEHTDKLRFPCGQCNKRFARSDQMKRHEATHNPNRFQGEPKYACEYCNKKYYLIGSYYGHRLKHHSDKKSEVSTDFTCEQCSKTFSSAEQLKRHERTHDPSRFKGEPKFTCDSCDKKYYLKASLDQHRKQHLGSKKKSKSNSKLTSNASANE